MKDIMIAMFIIGCLFLLLDTENMTIFFISKIIGILLIMPIFIKKF